MSALPHYKAPKTRQQARVLSQCRLLGLVYGDHDVSELETALVTLEEVGQVDQVVARSCLGVGNEFVVW